jgi:hypothetical protein
MTLKPDTINHSIQITHSSIESFGFELKTWNFDADNFSLSFSKKIFLRMMIKAFRLTLYCFNPLSYTNDL